MCGRYAITTDPALLALELDALDETESESGAFPHYNVAPTVSVPVLVRRHTDPDDEPTRRIRLMRWGLIPPWTTADASGAPTRGPLLFNARSETVATSSAFKAAFRSKRALVPMDGWYEWQVTESGKQPFYLHRGDGEGVMAAGLWSVWKPQRDAAPLLSVTIMTTEAVGELKRIHDRMPLILARDRYDEWLDPDQTPDSSLAQPSPEDVAALELRPVSTLVNSVRNNDPRLVAEEHRGDQGGDHGGGEQLTLL